MERETKRLASFLWALLFPAALMGAEPRYARLGEFAGEVDVQLRAADEWMAAERNLALPESAWVRTGGASRLEIELDEGSAWRLGASSQGEISDYSRLSTGQRVTLLSLDHGLAYFSGQPEGKDVLMLAVPGAQVTLLRAARIRLEVEESWSQIAVLEGVVRFSSPAAEIDLREGQITRVEPANPARFYLNKEIPAMESDKWSSERDKALTGSPSAAHVIERYGLADLDTAGSWTQTEDLGPVWKPKTEDGWLPFAKGRWRWYDALGYTWISGDSWGWLPYHYGRWTRREQMGWVWVPAKTAVFKPGDVYWLRGTKLAGWGPLAPGEEWSAPARPAQYLNVDTTFATFEPDAAVIDPEGFEARPKEPLESAAFVAALPSPALPAARLEARRPELRAGSTRVVPVLAGVTFQNAAPAPIVVVNPPPPPPLVVVTPPADAPPQEPQVQPVLVPYPVAVYTGITGSKPAPTKAAQPKPAPAKPAAGTPAPAASAPPPGVSRGKRFHAGERDLAEKAVEDVNGSRFGRALIALDAWSQRYRDSDYEDDRSYYYVLAHNGLQQPDKVVEDAAPLVKKGKSAALDDPRQMILALYLTSVNAWKLAAPTREQSATARAAARTLLDSAPAYFTAANRPENTSDADWVKARVELEGAARATLEAMRR